MISSKWLKPGDDLAPLRSLREKVNDFEPYDNDCDSNDLVSYHLILSLNNTDVAAGSLRYLKSDTACIDNIVVLPAYRRQGIGDGLVKVLDYKASQLGMAYSEVTAPSKYLSFFERIGYRKISSDGDFTILRKETNDGTRENCKD